MLFVITSSFVLLFLRHLEYILMVEFGSAIQPRTTVDEPCLTSVVNSNWQLILQLISRASKLLVTEGLQHEPDLTKRSFYWILSRGAYWENMVPCMPHWLMVIWVWEHGLVETKCKLRLVVVCGSLRINWEWNPIFQFIYLYVLWTGGSHKFVKNVSGLYVIPISKEHHKILYFIYCLCLFYFYIKYILSMYFCRKLSFLTLFCAVMIFLWSKYSPQILIT